MDVVGLGIIRSRQDRLTYEIGSSLSLITQEHIQSALLLSTSQDASTPPDNLIPLCEQFALKRGVWKLVHQSLDPKLLVETCKACNLEDTEPHRLEAHINACGVPEFLRGRSYELIRQFALKLNLDDIGDEETGTSLKVLLEDISDEIMLRGMEDWLKSFPRDLLEKWCTDLGIKFSSASDLADKAMVKIFSLKPLIKEDEPAEPETAPTATTAGDVKMEKMKKDKVGNLEELEKTGKDNKRKRSHSESPENNAPKKRTRPGKHQCPRLSNIIWVLTSRVWQNK